MSDILGELEAIGCDYKTLNKIERDLTLHPYNNGLTYSVLNDENAYKVLWPIERSLINNDPLLTQTVNYPTIGN